MANKKSFRNSNRNDDVCSKNMDKDGCIIGESNRDISNVAMQMPLSLDMGDLPEELEIDKPFYVNNVKYVLTKERRSITAYKDENRNIYEVVILKQLF